MKYSTIIISALVAVALPTLSQAATVAVGSTQIGDTGGINAVGAISTSSNIPGIYFSGATTLASDWVWSGDSNSVNAATYEFEFDLTGFDLTTAMISGLWGVDNTGTISLNGNLIATLSNVVFENFTNLHSYSTSSDSFFSSGLNTLRFDLSDASGQAGFRATGTVTADVSAVPLPASALLLLGGLGVVAGLKRGKKNCRTLPDADHIGITHFSVLDVLKGCRIVPTPFCFGMLEERQRALPLSSTLGALVSDLPFAIAASKYVSIDAGFEFSLSGSAMTLLKARHC